MIRRIISSGIERCQRELELPNGTLVVQNEWPSEATSLQRLYFHSDGALKQDLARASAQTVVDGGNTRRLEELVADPQSRSNRRLVFLSEPLTHTGTLSGTARVNLAVSVQNRRAANLTVAIVAYAPNGDATIITRGWADPQNHSDITTGQMLESGRTYHLAFDLEPKQARIEAGSRLGVVLASTDFEYTLRPLGGTELSFKLGAESYIDLWVSP